MSGKQSNESAGARHALLQNELHSTGQNAITFASRDWRLANEADLEKYAVVHLSRVLLNDNPTEEDYKKTLSDLRKEVKTINDAATRKTRNMLVNEAKKLELEINNDGTIVRSYEDLKKLPSSEFITYKKMEKLYKIVYQTLDTKKKKQDFVKKITQELVQELNIRFVDEGFISSNTLVGSIVTDRAIPSVKKAFQEDKHNMVTLTQRANSASVELFGKKAGTNFGPQNVGNWPLLAQRDPEAMKMYMEALERKGKCTLQEHLNQPKIELVTSTVNPVPPTGSKCQLPQPINPVSELGISLSNSLERDVQDIMSIANSSMGEDRRLVSESSLGGSSTVSDDQVQHGFVLHQ